MTKAQQKIVHQWCAVLALLLLLLLLRNWMQNNWDWLKWPVFLALIVGMMISQPSRLSSYKESSDIINRVVEEHPWIKVYLVIFCLCIAVVVYETSTTDFKPFKYFGFSGMIFLISLVWLPLWIIRETERFKRAGEEQE